MFHSSRLLPFGLAAVLALGVTFAASSCSTGGSDDTSANAANGLAIPEGLETVEQLKGVLDAHTMVVEVTDVGDGSQGGDVTDVGDGSQGGDAVFYPNGDSEFSSEGFGYKKVGDVTYAYTSLAGTVSGWYAMPKADEAGFAGEFSMTLGSFFLPYTDTGPDSALDLVATQDGYTVSGSMSSYSVKESISTTLLLDSERRLIGATQVLGGVEYRIVVSYPKNVPPLVAPEGAKTYESLGQ